MEACMYDESNVVFLVIRIFISSAFNLARTVHSCVSKQMLILTHYSPSLCQVVLIIFCYPTFVGHVNMHVSTVVFLFRLCACKGEIWLQKDNKEQT